MSATSQGRPRLPQSPAAFMPNRSKTNPLFPKWPRHSLCRTLMGIAGERVG
jgi:hypothetical protein